MLFCLRQFCQMIHRHQPKSPPLPPVIISHSSIEIPRITRFFVHLFFHSFLFKKIYMFSLHSYKLLNLTTLVTLTASCSNRFTVQMISYILVPCTHSNLPDSISLISSSQVFLLSYKPSDLVVLIPSIISCFRCFILHTITPNLVP